MDSGYPRGKESAMPDTLTDLHQQVNEDLRPETPLERIFAREIAFATWELERVREHANNPAAEAALAATYNRASRNWARARKELQRLQTARLNLFLRVEEAIRPHMSLYPMADPARVPAIKRPDPYLANLASRLEAEAAGLDAQPETEEN